MAVAAKSEVTKLVKKCTCSSSFQDQQYGVGLRLHSRVIRNKGSIMERIEDRCTVCFIRPYRLGGHGSATYEKGYRARRYTVDGRNFFPIGPVKVRG